VPGMLKTVRDALVSNRPTQNLIRSGSRSGVIPQRVYSRLPPLGAHTVTSPGGHPFTYVADKTDMLARGVVWGNLKVWEATSLRVFSELARTSERLLDVGAYSGVYSLIACADGPAEVIAFEPNPAIRPLLERNIRANGWESRITVVAKGASDASGTARMTIPEDTTAARVDAEGAGPTIELTTIDEVLGGRRADIIKVDVEGLEARVLAGAHETLARFRPALILESLTERSFEEIRDVLTPHGYDRCEHLAPKDAVLTTRYVDMDAYANFLWTAGLTV
jgi:FkbM family methyltransferase